MAGLVRFLVVLGMVDGLVACGGTVTKTDAVGSTAGAPGTNPDAAPKSQPLDDASGSYPALPPSATGAFFWRWGLGNWFVSSSAGAIVDADFEQQGDQKVWKATSEPNAMLDLWAELNHPSGTPLDLSAYSGISFEEQLRGASAPLVVAFNAHGNAGVARGASAKQQFTATDAWQTHELSFEDASANAAAISSVDFIIGSAATAFELRIRNLALRCKQACP